MSRSSQLASFLALGLATAACGLESAVVGGTCKPGYVEYGGACVVAPSGTPPTFERSAPAPSGSSSRAPSALTPTYEQPPPFQPYDPPLVPPPVIDPPVVDPPVDPPVLVCAAPLVACRGECISIENDPLNCGACGRICPSNICVARECVGATPGDVVLIGHDMSNVLSGSSQAKVLTNAVSIPTTDPIRILSYESGVPAQTAAAVRSLLGTNIKNRLVHFTTASAESLESASLYASYDVVLVHGASAGDPAALGGRWSAALQTFTKKGGVFVAIDGGDTDVPALVDATGLLTVASHSPIANGTQFVISGAGDVVGAQVLSPFAAFGKSVGFLGVPAPSADLTWVVRADDGPGLPTVIHKIVR